MNDWFNERYIKEIPIEEQIRRQVRAECHYMDKADIYEWITQNQIKIMNLQSKIDKANELIKRKLSTETYQHLKKLYDDIDRTEEIWEDYEFEDLQDILKEDK